MLYCLKCQKIEEIKNLRVTKINNGRKMLLSKCAVCDSKKIEIYQKTRKKSVK